MGYNPYELLVLLQAVVPFVSCASLVDAPPHRWSFSTGSPLRVPVCLLRSFVYTTGVLAADKPAPCVCVMRIQAHIRENARGRGRGRKKRDGENERKMMCTYAPLASSSGPRRSDHDRIEGDVSTRVKSTESTDTNGRRNAGVLWEFRLKTKIRKRTCSSRYHSPMCH